MKKRIVCASILCLGIGVLGSASVDVRAAGREPVASSNSTAFAASGVSPLLGEARTLCAAARGAFSPVYCGEELDADSLDRMREYYEKICSKFHSELLSFSELDGADAFDAASFAVSEMKYCQPKSPVVAKLEERVRELFSGENLQLEISESTLATAARRDLLESFYVDETIRGTRATGTGTLRGTTSLDVRTNENQAEFQIVLNADVATRTVGTNRGVRVYSDNFGRIAAAKPIFWSDSGLRTSPSVASGSMKSRVNGFDSKFAMLFNGAIIQNKVSQELPYTERESSLRMNSRVASELDAEANRALVDFNKRWSAARDATPEDDRLIRKSSSRTDDDRAYWSFVVGTKEQLTAASLSKTNAFAGRGSVSGRGIVRATPANRYASQSVAEKRSDVVFRAHQSAPNNAAFVALAGLKLDDQDAFAAVVARFPGVGRDEAAKFLENYLPKSDASSDENAETTETEKISLQFADERPFAVAFVDDKIETTLRFAWVQAGEREWRDLEMKFVYRVVCQDGGVAFQRELVDVLPGGLDPNAPIPARFQALRSLMMKRLEKSILDNYVVQGTPIRDASTGETKGTLVPTSASARDGWLEFSFDFQANAAK